MPTTEYLPSAVHLLHGAVLIIRLHLRAPDDRAAPVRMCTTVHTTTLTDLDALTLAELVQVYRAFMPHAPQVTWSNNKAKALEQVGQLVTQQQAPVHVLTYTIAAEPDSPTNLAHVAGVLHAHIDDGIAALSPGAASLVLAAPAQEGHYVNMQRRRAPDTDATPKQYTWQVRGLFEHLRQLFPCVGSEYTIDELRERTKQYPWPKVTIAFSKLRSMATGMDVQRDKARGVYRRVV